MPQDDTELMKKYGLAPENQALATPAQGGDDLLQKYGLTSQTSPAYAGEAAPSQTDLLAKYGLSDKPSAPPPTPVAAATAKASQSWLGDTWDWLWTGKYNDVMDTLGAPEWMKYTGTAAKAVQEGVGGITGAVLGGVVGGLEEAVYSQTSPGAMLLLLGTLGGSSLFEGAGEAAIMGTTRAGEAVEAGLAGAKGAEAGAEVAGKGAAAVAKLFTKADFQAIQKGMGVYQKAEALGQDANAALEAAGINHKMFQEALNILHRTGLGPTDVLNRGLIVNGGGQLLRSMGMGIGDADKLAKTGQILLDAGFSGQMLLGVGYNFPRIWEAAKEGNTEEAFRLASESAVFGYMGFAGLGAAKQHAGEAYGDILQKFGFNVKMDQARAAMRDIGNVRGRMETEGVVYAKNLDAAIHKKFATLGLKENDFHTAKILAEANLEPAKARERYNLLCENAVHPEMKVPVPTDEVQQAGPSEYYAQQGDSVHIPPQDYFRKAFNAQTLEDATAQVVRTPEDRALVDDYKKKFMAGKPGVSSAILLDEDGKVIGAENPHQALAYLELEKDHPGLRMPVATKMRSDQNPIHTSVEEDRLAKYAQVAQQHALQRAEAYGKDGVVQLLTNYRNAIDPTPAVRELAQWTRTEFLKALEYAHQNGVSIPAVEAYTTNMWEDAAKKNAAHEALKHSIVHDSKLRLNASMLHKRTFANAFEGEMEGNKLAVTDPVKLVANYWATISKLVSNRWALKAMQDKFIRTSDGMPVFTTAGTGRLVEGPNGENPSIFIDPRQIQDPDIAGKELEQLMKSGHLERLIQEGKIIKIDEADREGPKKPMFANPPVALTIKNHIDKQLKEGTPVGAAYNVARARMGLDPDMASSGQWAVPIYPEYAQTLDHPPSAAEIDAFAKSPERQKLLFDPRNNLSIWRDDKGTYHMDISFLTKDFDLAKAAGKTYNQMGIVQLDGKNFPFVDTGGDGTVPKTLPPGWEPLNERTNALYLRHEITESEADALLRNMSGEDTGHSQAYTLGRIDDEMKERAATADNRLFQKTERPEDLATAGAKFLWDQPTTFSEWKELMEGAYGKHLDKLGGDRNAVLQDLYEQSLHRALDIIKEQGVVPKAEPHGGYRPTIELASKQEIADVMKMMPGVTREEAIRTIVETEQAKAGFQGKPHALAVLNTNPIALLAAELADVEKATPYERQMRVQRALKDAGYTGGYNSWDPGRVTVFGDWPVEAQNRPLSETFGQQLQDKWDYTATQAAHATAILKGWAAMAGQSYEDFVNSRFAGIEELKDELAKEGQTNPESLKLMSPKDAETVRGMVTFRDDGKAVMYALKKGDFSTFLHEAGHVMRRGLSAGDQEILERTLGVEGGKWEVPHEEEFAQSLEQYMLEGEAPNKAMAGIFEKCRMWLRQVYLGLVGQPEVMKTIHPELRDVFDRMFGKDAINAEAVENVPLTTAHMQQAVANGGGQWIGIQEGPKAEDSLAMFNVPDGPAKGATVTLPVAQVTEENIRKAIAEKQEAFNAGLEKGPSVLYQSDQHEPTVADLQKEPKDKPRYVWNSHLYKTVPDSAFRNWNWAAYAPDGTKVVVNGELRVHPEMYDYVTRMFGIDESSLRKSPIFGPILKGGSIAKQTLLSLSPFHIPQIGLRAIMSGVLPRTIKWDLKTDSQLARLVENSLELGQHYNVWEEDQYQAGVMAKGNKGLVSLVPGVRDYQNWLQKFTFEKLLPSLKVLVAKELDDQYTKRFKNDQFYEKFLTEHRDFQGLDKVRASARAAAIETNERLGMLNYKDMGRAAGTQDALRLLSLAPDWLESEIRMVKRMFDPSGGKILRRDMAYMVGGMWVTSRVLNMLFTGQMHHEAPFGVAVKGDDGKEKVYSIRTLPTDMLHLSEDPWGFMTHRASPQARALAEVVHGRDAFGRQLTPWQQTMDLTRNIMPIPLQAVGKIATGEMPQMTSTEQMMQASGLTVTPFRDEAQKLASKLASSHSEQGPVDPAELRKHQLMQEYEFQLQEGKIRPEDIYQMTEDGHISVQEAKRIIRTAHDTTGMDPDLGRLYTQVSHLNMKDFLQVWAVMNDQEKAATAALLTKKKVAYLKTAMKSMTPAERKADPTYTWIRSTFPLQAPWGEE